MDNWKLFGAIGLTVGLMSALVFGGDRDLSLNHLVAKLNGSPQLLGRVVSADAGPSSNLTTASPFAIPAGSVLKLACPNLDSTYVAGIDGGVAGANNDRLAGQTSAGLYPIPAEKVITLRSQENVVSFFPLDGGTAGCNVYQMW